MYMIGRLIVVVFLIVQIVVAAQWAFAQTAQPPEPTPHTMINRHLNDQ